MRWTLCLILAMPLLAGCQNFSQVKRIHCEIRDSELVGEDITVKVTRYSQGTASDRSILLYPPTGGTNLIDRSHAKHLCAAGFDVYILNDWSGTNEKAFDLELHKRLYERARLATATVLTQVKSPFIGMLGTSLGATFAAVMTNLFEEFDAVFVVVGGASMPSIIVHSDQKAMRELKTKRFQKYAFKSNEEYQSAIESVFPLNPLITPPLYKKKTLGMIYSPVDTTVPGKDQLELKALWSPQTAIEVPSSHFMTIIKSWLVYQEDIVDFFIRAAEKSPSPAA